MTKSRREPQIELYRTLCMFGVCLLHALTQGGLAGTHRGLDNLMTPSDRGVLIKVLPVMFLVFICF